MVSVTKSSEKAPFTSEIEGLILATGSCEKSQGGVTRARKLLQLATKSDFNAC